MKFSDLPLSSRLELKDSIKRVKSRCSTDFECIVVFINSNTLNISKHKFLFKKTYHLSYVIKTIEERILKDKGDILQFDIIKEGEKPIKIDKYLDYNIENIYELLYESKYDCIIIEVSKMTTVKSLFKLFGNIWDYYTN